MIACDETTLPASATAAIGGASGLKLANVPLSLFTGEKIPDGMRAEAGPWKLFADAVRALLATPYVAVLFFAGGSNQPVAGLFPGTSKTVRLAEAMGGTADLSPCRDIAYRFRGLLSTCDAVRACACPLRDCCGSERVDTIRLESHGVLLGDLMLFAETRTPIGKRAAERVKAVAQTLADSLLEIVGQNGDGG